MQFPVMRTQTFTLLTPTPEPTDTDIKYDVMQDLMDSFCGFLLHEIPAATRAVPGGARHPGESTFPSDRARCDALALL